MYHVLIEIVFAFGIVAICVSIHSSGLVILFEWLLRRRAAIVDEERMLQYTVLLIFSFSTMIILHLAATAIWAAFYYWRGLFNDYETALYFSLGSYTTIGYGDVLLPQRWRLLGGIEGISGVMLCGLSAAFVFALVNAAFQIRNTAARQRATDSRVF